MSTASMKEEEEKEENEENMGKHAGPKPERNERSFQASLAYNSQLAS